MEISTLQAHDVYTTLHQHQCNVTSLHRRWWDIVSFFRSRWVLVSSLWSQHITSIFCNVYCHVIIATPSNGKEYGIEQNCVYGPLQKISAVAWKVTMIKNQRITPSVSTETCDVSQPMKVLSDTCLVSDLLGVATTVVWCRMTTSLFTRIYRLLSNILFFARIQTRKLLLPAILKFMVCRLAKNNDRNLFSSSANFLIP